MPVRIAVENERDRSIVAYRFFGPVSLPEIVEASKRAYAQITPEAPYRTLLIFEEDTDLSELNQGTLEEILAFGESEYLRRNLGPRAGAAVLNGSADAKILLPLFNAIGLARGGVDLSFELFHEMGSALAHLAIPDDVGGRVISKTK